jgi:hypothetical protein
VSSSGAAGAIRSNPKAGSGAKLIVPVSCGSELLLAAISGACARHACTAGWAPCMYSSCVLGMHFCTCIV